MKSWPIWMVLGFLLAMPAEAVVATETAVPGQIRVPKPRSEHDVSQQYYVALLRKALQKAAAGRPLPDILPVAEMEQGRAVRELQKGQIIDLFWMGTDRDKEQQLRAIRIPLERGLMGFRMLTIRRSQVEEFNQISSLQQLRKLTACQGLSWPDTKILQSAGLKVQTSPVYENLFKQVNAGRCDYFPRGLHEGQTELRERAALYPDLVRYPNLMLHYPFAIYFFTGKQNETLAQWIEQGLEMMITDGELLAHMQQHPLTAHVFPLSQFSMQHWLELKNPGLSPDTRNLDRRYWFVPADFSASQLDKNLPAIQPERQRPEQHDMQQRKH
jgi:hypothetical protein